MDSIRLIAVDIDGVLLVDTFSPVLRAMVVQRGGQYSRELERSMLSRNQREAARFVIDHLGLPVTEEELIAEYFRERAAFLATHHGGLLPGALAMLDALRASGAPLLCYGGLERRAVHPDFARCEGYFSEYLCTNAFRPGVKEIVARANLRPDQVLFLDDVNTVAEACRGLGCGFVGLPATEAWSWQRSDMAATGVRYCVSRPEEITPSMLEEIDHDVAGCFERRA